MVAFEEVEESGRPSAPLRAAVEAALAAYALGESRVRPLSAGGINATFRIDAPPAGEDAARDAATYVLRISRADEPSAAAIESELTWLTTLRRDAGLLVPEPVVAADRSRVVRLPADGGAEPGHAVLFHWLPGEVLSAAESPLSYLRVGELMARLHRHSERFAVPPDFVRPRYDPDRILGAGEVIPHGSGEALLSPGDRADLDQAAEILRTQIRALGEGPGVFGLIHGDLQVTNYLFHHGKVGAIDFADFGWGYYLYDVAAALLPAWEQKEFPALREAFLRGYRRVRPLAEADEASLEPLAVARALFVVRWTIEHWDHPAVRETGQSIVPHLKGHIRRFLERRSAGRKPPAATERRTAPQLLSHFRGLGIRLWEEGGRLRFKAPKGVMTPELRAELSEGKAEILAFLQQTTGRPPEPPIVCISRDRDIPLSFAQQRLWVLDQFEPGSPAYNISQAVRLRGSLRAAVLEVSLNEVIRRHEALRTTFATVDDRPVQVIAPTLKLPLPLVDLRQLPEAERAAEAWELLDQEALRPFDLARGPLVRFTLLRVTPSEHLLLLSFHHIISDGWSSGVFLRELAALYEALTRGEPSPLPELPIQYADFSHWQREWLQGETLEAQLSYWKQQLEGAPEALELPCDRPRPALRTHQGARRPLALVPSLSDAFQSLSRQHGATLFMTLLAAFKALLYRILGRPDIVVGTPIANRNRAAVEGLIGFFVNTLVLRSHPSGDATFRELLVQVREVTLGAYAHQDLPFEHLVDELKPPRDPSRTPLFQILFTVQDAPSPGLEIPGLVLSYEDPEKPTAKFDLSLALWEASEGLQGVMKYNTDLFDTTTILRLGRQYGNLLEGIAGEPDARLKELSLFGPSEKHQLLREWNDTRVRGGGELCVHELFEIQAAERPEAEAVRFGGQRLSYRELNVRANQLAWHLGSLGVGPEVLVGIHMEHSLEIVIAFLGVLKAGGAYLPLDASYPRERVAAMLQDSQPPVVLTQDRLRGELPEFRGQVVSVDQEELGLRVRGDNPASGVTAENLAYGIYTSGSTGRPKGILISHGALANHMFWIQRLYPLAADDSVLHKTPFSFDPSVGELLAPLVVGARLVMARPGSHRDPAHLVKEAGEVGSATLQVVPSLLRVLMQEPGFGAWRGLKRVYCGGEALSPEIREEFFQRCDADLVNVYGPAEAAIHATAWNCERRSPARRVPIGRPILNVQVYVLDPALKPLPIGVPGELCIGGAGVGRGYLHSPGMTAEKFVPDPFRREPDRRTAGARLYKSGDLARSLPDGTLEFLGRRDHQVKVRGFRLEPGEIETSLRQHPTVDEAVVLARSGGQDAGDLRLIVYLVAASGQTPVVEEMRRFLTSKLPHYMMPSDFVVLEALPLGPSGKVDRRALAAIGGTRLDLATAFVAPRNPLEQQLAEIWGELLHRERIGIHDNFFDLGGNSLLVTQLMSRLRNHLQADLTFETFFEGPTVAGLAKSIEVTRQIVKDLSMPPMDVTERREEGEL